MEFPTLLKSGTLSTSTDDQHLFVSKLPLRTQIDDRKVLYLLLYAKQTFIHHHALRVCILAEPNAHYTVLLDEDGLQRVSNTLSDLQPART
jgi:hypothetical protein